MDKHSTFFLRLIVILAFSTVNVLPALSQESCRPVPFNNNYIIMLKGTVSPEGMHCYSLETEKEQRISLKVIKGDNIIFSIEGVTDAQDRFTFVATKSSYDIIVAQLVRARRSEAFRISISKTKANSTKLSALKWPVWITNNPVGVGTQHRSTVGNSLLTIDCNKQLGPGVGSTLTYYRGNALERIDDVSKPVTFVVTQKDGQKHIFYTKMHYFAPDRAWVLSEHLPVAFVEALIGGSVLTLQNAGGANVLDFDLAGIEEFGRAVSRICG